MKKRLQQLITELIGCIIFGCGTGLFFAYWIVCR